MGKTVDAKLTPLREDYKLSDETQAILERFGEEMDHRLGGVPIEIEIYKENLLTYPSMHSDMITFEIRVGNWRRLQVISEIEIDNRVGGSFFYFCRSIVDNVMADLLKIGAARA